MEAAAMDGFSTPPGSTDFALSGKIMLSAIIILLFVVILIISLHLYARWYILRARRRGTLRRRNRLVFYFEPPPAQTHNAAPLHRGLDSSVLSSLPVFTFSPKSHSDPLDCAVCLSEFEESELGRTLPSCGHSFHTECIDMWFHSHDTCPLCRSPVEPVNETTAEAVAVSVQEPAMPDPGSSSGSSGFCVECDRSDRMALSSAGSRSFRSRRKPADVSIEIPRRSDGEFAAALSPLPSSTPFTPSFKSPISRVMSLSFKRIIGREKRGGLSPSGNVAGCSSGAGGDLDIEKGKESVL